MENFVLNLFSDQLSKVILNFHPSTINANFLSGKGSITNLRLNVDVINEFLNKPPHGTVPFVKFTEIRLSGEALSYLAVYNAESYNAKQNQYCFSMLTSYHSTFTFTSQNFEWK